VVSEVSRCMVIEKLLWRSALAIEKRHVARGNYIRNYLQVQYMYLEHLPIRYLSSYFTHSPFTLWDFGHSSIENCLHRLKYSMRDVRPIPHGLVCTSTEPLKL
jgi:hypothetical protein